MSDPMVIKVETINKYIAERKEDIKAAEAQVYALEKLLSDLGYGKVIDPPVQPI